VSQDRITQLSVAGLRCIEACRLATSGLTVLIGDNGTGKSTLIEASELLRQAARPGTYTRDVVASIHGGPRSLLRHGATCIELSVRIEGEGGPPLEYLLKLRRSGEDLVVDAERLLVYADPAAQRPLGAIVRNGTSTTIFDTKEKGLTTHDVPLDSLALTSFGLAAQPAMRRATGALAAIAVHVPFDTRPGWLGRGSDGAPSLRDPQTVEPAPTLSRYGRNLTNCLYEIKNSDPAAWTRVIERAALGLGDDLRDISFPSPSRGLIETQVWFGRLQEALPLGALSEGQIAYLGFVALGEVGRRHSLIVMDEPEQHLHPGLLARMAWMIEELVTDVPVIVATHSDRFLDALTRPEDSVVLCELDESRATRLRRPDRDALARWLEDYRGIGELRTEGYEPHVFAAPDADADMAAC